MHGKSRDMKHLFLFMLTLTLCGAIALGHVYSGVTALPNVEMSNNPELISFESTDSNAIEVDGLRFETVVPNQTLSIPEHRPDAQTTWRFGVRVTNNSSVPKRVSKYSLTPQFRGLDGEVIFPQQGVQIHLVSINSSGLPLVLPGESFTLFWEGTFYWIENMLLLEVYQNSNGSSLRLVALNPGIYHVRLSYHNDEAEFSYYDQEKQQLTEAREVLKGQFSSPWVEINLVYS